MAAAEAGNMENKRDHDRQLEKLMNDLADSVLELSDEEVLSEAREVGADPQQQGETTRAVLQQASKTFEDVNRSLSNLAHTVEPKLWRRRGEAYYNNCVTCGLSVSFTPASNQKEGDALTGPCPDSGRYAVSKREAIG